MGVLSDFFIAEKGKIPEYGGGSQFPSDDRLQLKNITPLEAANLLAVLLGEDDPIPLLTEFKLLTPEDAEEWIYSIPSEMVVLLGELDSEDRTEMASQFANATAEELGASPQDFEPIISKLSTLSRRAIESKQSLYLWMSL
jgi:hypothetical protein